MTRFRLKYIAAYYSFSLALMSLFPWATHLAGDSNLPPQQPLGRWIINLILLNAGLAYAVLLTHRMDERLPKRFWAIFLAIAVLLCAMPPVFSGDLYEYLIRGRILGVYHQNPYAHTAIEFSQDSFFSHSIWIHTAENYGPAWTLIQWIMPTFFGQSVGLAVFMQKILILCFFAASGLIFFKVAQAVTPAQSHALTRAFLLNPNLWVHHLVDGHNDIVMVFWMLLAVFAMTRDRMTLSLAAATMGVLVKFTSLILLSVSGIAFLKSMVETKQPKKFWPLIQALAISVFLAVICYLPFWIGKETLGYFSTFKGWFYSNSVPYAFYALLTKIGIPVSAALVKKGFIIFFVVNASVALVWLWKRPRLTPLSIFRTVLWMFLALYTSYAIPFYGNHFTWAMPFLILSQVPLAPLALMLYTMAGVFSYFKRLSFLYVAGWLVYLAALWIISWQRNRSLKETI